MTEKQTHWTPGPWAGKETDPNDFHKLIEITAASRAGKVPICKIEVGFTGPIEDEQRANGRLIAAAPTMAEALKALLDQLDAVHADPRYRSVWEVSQLHVGPYNGPTYTAEYEAARAALAAMEMGRHD